MDHILETDFTQNQLWLPDEDPPEPWKYDAMVRFRERMAEGDNPFPCVFGVDATRRGTLRCTFVPAGSKRVPQLAQALSAFVDRAVSYGRRTSLVAFFESVDTLRTVQDYRDHFWYLLTELRKMDDMPWPEGISADPEDCFWEYSYHGMPLFIVANTPAHDQRRSRQFEYFTITFQPRFVFDDLTEESPAGQRARKVIRKRLQQYDAVPASPSLASFGKPGTREWVQYFLDDTNEPVLPQARCPLGHTASATSLQIKGDQMSVSFDTVKPPVVPADLRALLPQQGSYELQNDGPGKTHNWHYHSLDEELFVLDGSVTMFWLDEENRQHSQECPAGTWIRLAANTHHGSTAGPQGAVYMIRPEGGATAVTTFLDPSEYPDAPSA